MPSEIKLLPNLGNRHEAYELDNRYGGHYDRKPYPLRVAQDMARLDDLIEEAGIKPGDRLEVLWRRHPEEDDEAHCTWGGFPEGIVFRAVYNGRLMMVHEGPEEERYGGFDTWTIFKVRKVSVAPADE